MLDGMEMQEWYRGRESGGQCNIKGRTLRIRLKVVDSAPTLQLISAIWV